MALLHTLGAVSAFWGVLFLLDRTARNYRLFRTTYAQCLERWGVTVSFAHLRCYTTAFNPFFYRLGNCNKTLSRVWFGAGALVGVILMLSSVVVLLFALYQVLSSADVSEQVLTPVMPGVNMPWNDIAYYILTLIVCGVFHEVGHAFAASLEQVRVNGFGVFVLFLYPGAFVDLHTDHLSVISPKRQLRIYCAGVWHNVILVLCALLFLWSLPAILSPLYFTGGGVAVTSLPYGSVLADKMEPGEILTSLNSCPVYLEEDWFNCIDELATNPQHGYCVAVDTIENNMGYHFNQTTMADDGGRECCQEESLSDICFQVAYGKGQSSTFKCLTARRVSARETCHNSRDCRGVVNFACVFPAVAPASRLVRISRHDGQDVLFLGDPRALPYTIAISGYLPFTSYSMLWLPSLLQTFSMYVVSISSALALLNMVPAYFLDGQWALTALIELLFEDYLPSEKHRRKLCNGILISGSLLLGSNLALALWTLANW